MRKEAEKERESGGFNKGRIIYAAVGFLVAVAIVGGIIFILRNTDQHNQNTSSPVPGLTL